MNSYQQNQSEIIWNDTTYDETEYDIHDFNGNWMDIDQRMVIDNWFYVSYRPYYYWEGRVYPEATVVYRGEESVQVARNTVIIECMNINCDTNDVGYI